MTLLILGLILWAGLHLLRSLAPDLRQTLQSRLGDGAKGLIALGLLLSLGLMIVGYRQAAFVAVWSPPGFLLHLNNLLMILALYVYLTSATKPGTAWIMGRTRNPQLTGFKIWAVAHLLVNGDLASILLFGGLLAWAVVEVIVTKNTPSLVNRDTARITSPFVHLGLVIVVFAVVAVLHTWAGRWPFPG